MSTSQKLYPPEGCKLSNIRGIEKALNVKFAETGDVRYKEINQRLKHISGIFNVPIKLYAMTEKVTSHAYVTIAY